MIERDLAELLTALVVISACAAAAVVTASPRGRSRGETGARRPEDDIPIAVATVITRETSPPAAPAPPPATAPPATPGSRARPRILTGEPAEPEAPPHPTRRAFRFVGGITALAAGGAIGLLALVRALVAMFRRIGG